METKHRPAPVPYSALNDAFDYALSCLAAAHDWNEQTLSINLVSTFPELGVNECQGMASFVLYRAALKAEAANDEREPSSLL